MENRKIDIVFVIDGTGSMAPCIDMIKDAAKEFYQKFNESMIKRGSTIDSLRIKNIVFRDYETDGALSMEQSAFFEIPTDLADYEANLNSISAQGGGDLPENGLEALHYAFNSDFVAIGPKDREVIVLFTDADALDLHERSASSDYPKDMVDMAGLTREWIAPAQESGSKLTKKGKRLVIYAPASSKYADVSKKLPSSNFVPVELGTGLVDFSFDEIINIIAASASN